MVILNALTCAHVHITSNVIIPQREKMPAKMSFQIAERTPVSGCQVLLIHKAVLGKRDWALAQLDASLPGEAEKLHGTNIHFHWNVLILLLSLQHWLAFNRLTLIQHGTGSSKISPCSPLCPSSCPPCSHPYTFKPLIHRTLSEFLTLIHPSSLLTSLLVIFLDFLVASHLFSLRFLSFLFLPSCPPRGICPPGR